MLSAILSSEGNENVTDDQTITTRSRTRAFRWTAVGVGLGAVALGTAGCGPSLTMVSAPWGESQAVIQSTLFGEKDVTFDESPVISVENGRITDVSVTSADGKKVDGEPIDGGAGWKIDTSDLDFGTKYLVTANAVDLRGKETTTSDSFKTFVPENELTVATNLTDGDTYGVGMPIIVTFSQPVKDRAAIEEKLLVTVDDAPVEGSWHWDSDTQVTYRPKTYWPADSKVELDAEIKGVNAGNQTYAMTNKLEDFKTGPRMILIQDSEKHQMVVKKDGKTIRTIPTSSGRPGYDTRSGTKVIMSKEPYVVMDAASLGVSKDDPNYYRLEVYNAMRITWSGEYIHSAPWSMGSQGYANVSHGCINVSPDNAAWLMDTVHVGDVVEVKNTPVSHDGNDANGWTQWNVPYTEWEKGSALPG